MSELKKCPFCGSSDSEEFRPYNHSLSKVICLDCESTASLEVWQSRVYESQLAEAREAICIHVREHMDCGGIDNDDEAVIYFKNTFNEKNYN
jgi:transposase-like protein